VAPNAKWLPVASLSATDALSGVAPDSLQLNVDSSEPFEAKDGDVMIIPTRTAPWMSGCARSGPAIAVVFVLAVPAIEHREIKHVLAVEIDGLRVGASRRIALAHEMVQTGIALEADGLR
jgi:hypothetical protein